VIFMVLRLEDIEKSPLSKPMERAGNIEELRNMANKKTMDQLPDKPISPDIRITQTKSTRDQETTIEIVSHDITDLKMILDDIGYDNRDGLLTKIRSALRDLKNR
jgi:predicted signal transduction protein with EAL and GGDEF domain